MPSSVYIVFILLISACHCKYIDYDDVGSTVTVDICDKCSYVTPEICIDLPSDINIDYPEIIMKLYSNDDKLQTHTIITDGCYDYDREEPFISKYFYYTLTANINFRYDDKTTYDRFGNGLLIIFVLGPLSGIFVCLALFLFCCPPFCNACYKLSDYISNYQKKRRHTELIAKTRGKEIVKKKELEIVAEGEPNSTEETKRYTWFQQLLAKLRTKFYTVDSDDMHKTMLDSSEYNV